MCAVKPPSGLAESPLAFPPSLFAAHLPLFTGPWRPLCVSSLHPAASKSK